MEKIWKENQSEINAPSSALTKKIKVALDGVEDKDGDSIVSDTAAYHEKHSELRRVLEPQCMDHKSNKVFGRWADHHDDDDEGGGGGGTDLLFLGRNRPKRPNTHSTTQPNSQALPSYLFILKKPCPPTHSLPFVSESSPALKEE